MRLDRDKINALAALNDDALWEEIKKMTAEYSISLPEKTPPHEELQKLRSLFCDSEKINLFGAMKLLNNYKRGIK